ncbi:hypothetical protein RSSM_01150 [Rhodopirellula sallentina SM41]|uniref:Uncharacterized protein n=2 Tax=Rhodopirellula TaxID=265488 RepID=M5U7R6_9BACT|nr:hypothetical protein RSSM_01150 [Rhodopirellula sallentina SM41]
MSDLRKPLIEKWLGPSRVTAWPGIADREHRAFGWVGMIAIVLLAGSVLLYPQSVARADEGLGSPNQHGQRKLSLRSLPEPPAELKQLIGKGDITFLIGGTRPSVVDPSRSTGTRGRTFDAETQFRLSYTFKSRCRWAWNGSPNDRELAIGVGYDRLRLNVSHLMWFEDMPDREAFWESPLVLHEFDHVRLSTDPRVTSRFLSAVRKQDRVILTREESEPLITAASRRSGRSRYGRSSVLRSLTGGDAQPWLKEIVSAEFQKAVDLIGIRYRELDRQTDHGKFAVPRSGDLHQWLNP